MTQSIAWPESWWVVAATALAWLGFFIHNIADLPGQSLFSPETGLPTLYNGSRNSDTRPGQGKVA
jgi:hypothetical protein